MRKSFLKNRRLNTEMSLQITSMADIFTIILVFLLKSYTTGAINLSPSKGVILPEAHAADVPVEALKVEISAQAVQVEGEPSATLKAYSFDQTDMQGNGTSKSLGQVMERERNRQLLISKSNSDVKVDSKVLIIADQHTPYSTIKTVLATAAVSGYTDFKLAVIRGD